jgi:hypothetical protein
MTDVSDVASAIVQAVSSQSLGELIWDAYQNDKFPLMGTPVGDIYVDEQVGPSSTGDSWDYDNMHGSEISFRLRVSSLYEDDRYYKITGYYDSWDADDWSNSSLVELLRVDKVEPERIIPARTYTVFEEVR